MALPRRRGLSRRAFIGRSAGGAAGLAIGSRALAPATSVSAPLPRVDALPTGVTRTWIGPQYWGNRLQDWRLAAGRIECLRAGAADGCHTVGVLTREIVAGNVGGSLSVRTGTLAGGPGFSGFLVGAGSGLLDHRAAALVTGASGTGGGVFCVYESSGRVGFRDHSDEANQFAYRTLAPTTVGGVGPARTLAEDVELRLDVVPLGAGRFELRLAAVDVATGTVRSAATRTGFTEANVRGGIALVSSPAPGASGARYWFRELRSGGAKVAARDARAVGPILGTLFSVAGGTLKMTAQLMPLGAREPQSVRLDYRIPGGTWRLGPTVSIGAGFCATFRIDAWGSTRAWEYRVVHAPGAASESVYAGRIPAEPAPGAELRIGMVNCSIHSFRPLDRPSRGTARIAGERDLGLYTDRNLYFPYARLAANVGRHQPHVLLALGDQMYEHRPTLKDVSPAPLLDHLGKYALWLLSFRELTRDRPTIVLVDDHDVGHGNLWGHEGAAAPAGDQNLGGYVKAPEFVNAVERMQCSHNPDPHDATPVLQGITVYYAMFRYGAASFAILEDRKFKTGDADGLDASGAPFPAAESELLGVRQEQFLSAWRTAHAGLPKVAVTQTLYACLQTRPDGTAARDFDSNGYPAVGRNRALRLLKAARALMLAGDQHLASVVRHGIADFTDGPVQFVAPAVGSAWTRWFEPPGARQNGTGTRYTGDFTDAFGNRLRVLAVANPKVSFDTFAAAYGVRQQNLGDQALKRDGYGLVRVDPANARYVIECWPADQDPTAAGAAQYPGWPRTLPFSQA